MAKWYSVRLETEGCRFKPHQRHCVMSWSKTLYPLLSTGLTRKCSNITETLLTGV